MSVLTQPAALVLTFPLLSFVSFLCLLLSFIYILLNAVRRIMAAAPLEQRWQVLMNLTLSCPLPLAGPNGTT